MTQIIGQVSDAAKVEIGGSLLTAGKEDTGKYSVTYANTPFTSEPVVVATCLGGGSSADAINISDSDKDGFSVTIKSPSGNYTDKGFNFISTDDQA